MTGTREGAIARAHARFDDGLYRDDLARRVAIPSESQNPDRGPALLAYLEREMRPELETLGFTCEIWHHEKSLGPFLFAERIEDPALPTVLGYGHGDVIRGLDDLWAEGLSPWTLVEKDGRYYGRGVVDNKGQHLIDTSAMAAVIAERGRLGFNAKFLVEMGEENGSPGLHEIAAREKDRLKADVLIASDGPRLSAERPTLFLGARGGYLVDLIVEARDGGHHSGNWGGLISNPGIQLAHAIAAIVGPTGQIRVPALVPKDGIPANVRAALADCVVDGGPDAPEIEPWWGEPGLTPAEKVFGWCNFEVLAYETGNPRTPVNAIPPRAWARCQLRFVVGVDIDAILPAIRAHLDRAGLPMVQVVQAREGVFHATRLDPDDPWVRFAAASIQASTGKKPAILPNLGSGLPNDVFSDILGLPTVWVPHSYPGCSQHAPNEHVPTALVREALGLMAGLYWDIGADGAPGRS